jgi:predicted transcriptional regulator
LATETNKLFQSGKIPDELKPKDMSRFCDNLYLLIINVGQEENIKNIIKHIITKIQSTKTNQIPRSISLFQYFVAILVSDQIIEPSTKNYHWHITQEVTTLYPSLENISFTFQYDQYF